MSRSQALLRAGVRVLISAVVFLFPFVVNAAQLQEQTLRAWEEYVQAANSRMQQRLHEGGPFLVLDENANWSSRVRNGEILVFPAGPHIPKKVPFGLIHDWIGAAFIQDSTIDEIVAVSRDYEQYKNFYRPTVLDSKALVRELPDLHSAPTAQTARINDTFSMLLMNRELFSKVALDGDYESSYFQLDDHRWYSLARTTHVREIQSYGQLGEHKLPEGEGSGLIWRLSSITRFEERDGGVYVELQAMGLSRDVPFSLRWVADPIIRRVSRDSLATSLQQTGNAVRARRALAATPPNSTVASMRRSY
jgi:hypothetical protein